MNNSITNLNNSNTIYLISNRNFQKILNHL